MSTACGRSCAGAAPARARSRASSTTRSRGSRPRSGTWSGQHYGVPIHRLLGGRVPRLGAHVRRLPRGRGAALDGRDDGRAPGALGAGAAGGGRRRLAAQPRARPRVREGASRTRSSRPSCTRRGRGRSSPTSGSARLKFDLDVPTPYMQDTASGTLSRAEIKYMVELAAAVIDAVGDEVDVAFDCHWRYQVSDACRLAHELEHAGADVARGPGAAGERRRRWRG